MLNIFMMLQSKATGAHSAIADLLPGAGLAAQQITLNTVVEDMSGLSLPHPEIPAAALPLDYILELRPDPGVAQRDLWDATRPVIQAAGLNVVGGFFASEVVQVNYNRYWRDGEESPGPKVIWLARKRVDVAHNYFVRRWRQHALMVWRIHTGIWRYTQNLIEQDVAGNMRDVTGVAITHYRSVKDFLTHQYADERARREVTDDVSAFTASAEAYVTRERILRSPTPEPQPFC